MNVTDVLYQIIWLSRVQDEGGLLQHYFTMADPEGRVGEGG